MDNIIAQKIKYLLSKNKIQQKELAESICVSKTTIGAYVRNECKPSPKILSDIADYFGVTTDYLLGREMIVELNKNSTIQNKKELKRIIEDLEKNIEELKKRI